MPFYSAGGNGVTVDNVTIQDTDGILAVKNGLLQGNKIAGLNCIKTLINRAGVWSAGQIGGWGDAYINANGRENSVDASQNSTGVIFDINKYKAPNFHSETEYIIVEANSFGSWTNGTNDVYIYKIGNGKWIIYCDTGSDNVKRAQIHKSLWYGTDGTNQLILDFTGITSVKTSNINDVGKRAHYATLDISAANNSSTPATYTGTFVNTSTNNNINSWSKLISADNGAVTSYSRWEIPSGTIKTTVSDLVTLDHFGTDRTIDDVSNVANCQLDMVDAKGTVPGGSIKTLILTKDDITWVHIQSASSSVSNIDYYTDNSIPDMIIADTIVVEVDCMPIQHTIPTGSFSATVNKCIGVPLIEDWENGADIQYKLTNATEDTGWLNAKNPELSSFTAFTSEPTTLTVSLISKSTTPTTGYPSIKGFWINCND